MEVVEKQLLMKGLIDRKGLRSGVGRGRRSQAYWCGVGFWTG